MTRWLPAFSALSILPLLVACSSNDPSGGTGGTPSTGGGAQTGGAPGTTGGMGTTTSGGAQTTGGAPATTGGAATTGGSTPGTGGAGNAGSGGKATGGGSGTTGGAGPGTGGGSGKGGSAGATTGGSGGGKTTGGAPGTGGATGGGAGAGTGGSGGAPVGGNPCRGTKATGFVADGLCAVQVGTVANARQITFSSNGDLWVTASNGQIRRLRDANNNGTYEAGEIVNWATTGGNGQNSHIDEKGGFLYSGSMAGVKRFPWTPTSDMGGAGEDVMTGQPGGGNHPKHTVHVWDGFMYVMSGSSGNVSNEGSKSEYDTTRSVIKRFPLENFKSGTPLTWSSGEVFARGTRNVLGFNRDAMGRIFGVQNGQDDVRYNGADVHNDNPGEAVLRLEMGSSHGYPFCFAAQQITGVEPGTQVASEIYSGNTRDNAWCGSATNAVKPVTFTQAHSAPMDIIFFTGTSTVLPSRWMNGAFISLHGSWNRNPGSGKKVVWVPFNADGTSPMPTVSGSNIGFPYEVVFGESGDKIASGSGASSNGGFRPVGLAISPIDGALYISSDGNGFIYRVGTMQ